MSADEFQVIRDLFAPLCRAEGARGLLDDAAILDARGPLVVTTDAIVEGVHFLPDDPIETIAMKALRVNVSDLLGKGARPHSALLTLVWPRARPAAQIEQFARGLGRDLAHYQMSLLGGDTTSTDGPLTIVITAFGQPLGPRTPARSDAEIGDDVWLAGGEIGSAWMGLQLRTGAMRLQDLERGRDRIPAAIADSADMPDYLRLPGAAFDAEAAWLMTTYLAPFVQADVAPLVARFAHASMDVSDGLAADAAKLAAASGVCLRIEAARAPLSIPAMRWVSTGGDLRALLSGGDDYTVLFTAPREARETIEASDERGVMRLARIGKVEAGAGVLFMGADGEVLSLPDMGFAHRLGR
jgi:thiamine-monophosphate kinase